MSSVKPFKSDLAAWSIEYVKEQVALYGVTANVETVYNDAGDISSYWLEYPIYGTNRGLIARFEPRELVEAYQSEMLDMIAHRFAYWVRRKIEEMGNG